MKRVLITLKIFLIGLILITSQPSCTKLEEEVYSDLTADKFFADPDNLIYAFGVAYTNLYNFAGHKFGMVGSEVGTDMLIVPQRGGDWYDGGEWIRFHRHTWNTTDNYFNHWWANIYSGITTCNKLIEQFESLEGVDVSPAIAELRALRGLYYYWLIDKFGNVPIVDKFSGADEKPASKSRLEVYNFIETELTEALPDLSKETGLAYYGRMNYYAAYMVLAKLYLNAEVYTGTPQWEKAYAACDSIIQSGKFSLDPDFFNNFAENATASKEHILGVPYDQVQALGFEIHLFTLHYNLQNRFGLLSATWNGICAQEDFFNLFEETDVRLGGLLHGVQYDEEGNVIEDPSFEKFDPTNPTKPKDPDGAQLNLTPNVNMLEPNCLRQCGARIAKFPFIPGSDRYASNDFPIFRYADVLLMQAEILMHLGNTGEGLGYLNQVRARAGVADLTELTPQTLLDERARELYAEGYRRSDMIRLDKNLYLGTRWEKPDVTPEYRLLWPVPQTQIDANPNLTQNDGY